MSNFPVTDRLDYERGAICPRCRRRFNLGEPYATIIEGVASRGEIIGEAVCLPCATSEESCECGRPTSVCQFTCDFCTGGPDVE